MQLGCSFKSPFFAEIFMANLESQISSPQYFKNIIFWFLYVDDMLMLFNALHHEINIWKIGWKALSRNYWASEIGSPQIFASLTYYKNEQNNLWCKDLPKQNRRNWKKAKEFSLIFENDQVVCLSLNLQFDWNNKKK